MTEHIDVTRQRRAAAVEALLDHLSILSDGDAARAAAKELGWPDAPDYEGDLWVVDGLSPRELTEVVLHAIGYDTLLAEVERLTERLRLAEAVANEAANSIACPSCGYVYDGSGRPGHKAGCVVSAWRAAQSEEP